MFEGGSSPPYIYIYIAFHQQWVGKKGTRNREQEQQRSKNIPDNVNNCMMSTMTFHQL